ncbi:galactose-specific cell agglutination protein gsf2-like [Stegodyphus dumicola]|uniref:galactose-specific cell agglutination protein gsf2-like n=1 Tax=Stegodyphus dumicola TaxID=202533 RepID=UPI0015B0D42A|nr:galactose-specific cell agglutination protein gsf2-like [Stegodyphus dumicola]
MATSKIYKPTQIHATTNTSQSNGMDLTSTTINGILDQVFLKDDSAEEVEQKELRASTQTPNTPDDIPFTRKEILQIGLRGKSVPDVRMQMSLFMFSQANIAINGQLASPTTDPEEQGKRLHGELTKVTTDTTVSPEKSTENIPSDESIEVTTDITANPGKRAGPVILVATSMYMLNKPVIGLKGSEEGEATGKGTENATSESKDTGSPGDTSETPGSITEDTGSPGDTAQTSESTGEDTGSPGSTAETTGETSESTGEDTGSPGGTAETASEISENTGEDTGSPGGTSGTSSETSGSTDEDTVSPGGTSETSTEISGSTGTDTGSPNGTEETSGSTDEVTGSPSDTTGTASETSGSTGESTGSPSETTGTASETSESTGQSTGSPASTTETTSETSETTGEDTSSPSSTVGTSKSANEVKKRSAEAESLKMRSKNLSKSRVDGMGIKGREAILTDFNSYLYADALKANGSEDRALDPRNQAQDDWGKNGLNKTSKKKAKRNGMPIRHVRNYVMRSE